MFVVEPTNIPDVKAVRPKRFEDARGFFSEVFSQRAFEELGLDSSFVQDNHSCSASTGTVRGLHFQSRPYAQAKLIRVTAGRILDVAVDLRRSSPTYGQHVAVELSAENWLQLYIPVGFAHGFCTLEPNCHVVYKVTHHYSAAHDRGVLWNDPALGIDWPVEAREAVLSDKDAKQPLLASLPSYFD